MTEKNAKILITSGSILVGGAVIYFIYTKIRNTNIQNAILKKLAGGVGQYGSIEDFAGFKGKAFRDGISTSFNVIKLKDDVARQYADKIDKSWEIVNDDEDSVYQVFRQLKDQYGLSQVASVYEAVYKVPLLNKLKSKLSSDEQDIIYKIVKPYPNYRIA